MFVAPLAALYLWPRDARGTTTAPAAPDWWTPLGWSVLLSAGVAMISTVLGYCPGKLLGTIDIHSLHGRQRRAAALVMTALPMLLPVYVLCYAWAHLLDETSPLGRCLSADRSIAMAAGLLTAGLSLVTWYWPLAALILSQGWRGLDGAVLESARLDAGRFARFRKVTWPLMRMPILLAFGACLVLSMSETALFEIPLSTIRLPAIGRELSLAYEADRGDTTMIARGAWPLILPAAVLALALWLSSARMFGRRQDGAASQHPAGWRSWCAWVLFAVLLLVSCAAPAVLFALCLHHPGRFLELGLHADKLAWSAVTAVGAGVLALGVAWAALRVAPVSGDLFGADANSRTPWSRRLRKALSGIMQLSILVTMFLPPTLVAVAFVRIMAMLGLDSLRDSWCILSIGLAARYAGLALVILWQADQAEDRQLSELAAVDGASAFRAWWHVHLPRRWPLGAGALALVTIFSLTERPLTVVLLPAGLPSLSEWLMGVMHAVRGEEVIAACLVMIAAYLALAGVVLGIHRFITSADERQ
ncbi:MAG: ABC transporter permease [Phycisphaerae bacterium]